ncbi:Pyridoxal-dependent decarboxylase conserved domain protein [Aspergillus parasiticus SU-1]|uniref:Pyridoxal-dependent decarboxylase conserved domain protein n=1 Tax=Aspergillus parasiticus (strain ATCC 56775 / NRRL 5862 / SRRC 143 / SU-1) TaxID=1403190 RepID=A0A0F0I9W0_ASPPU|nr:Pyridoxal-dependent decarboxylase conserved domain protein [Aspergillus parasiticus SU-1]
MDPEQFRTAGYGVIDDIIHYFATLPSNKVLPEVTPGYLRPQLPSRPPEEPQPWSEVQADLERIIKPGLTHWQHPHFMAFFPSIVTYPSILGEMYSAAWNAPGFNWLCSPACTELETVVLDWVAQACGLPECFHSTGPTNGGGVIYGTASEAIATMVVAARERIVRRLASTTDLTEGTKAYEDKVMDLRQRLVALGSDQAHSSTAKAALVAGVRYRSVPTNLADNMVMKGDALLDDFEGIKAVLRERKEWSQIWVHTDAAYAGAALVAEEYQHIAAQWADNVDSFDFNMHKWLLVNFDASCCFVRNRKDLTEALEVNPSYLRNNVSDTGTVVDYRNWQIPLGRRFRSLKVGIEFAEMLRSRPDLFKIITQPAFALTVFRVWNTSKSSTVDSDALTRKVYETIHQQGDFFLTSTVLGGVYAIRVVNANQAAHVEHVRKVFGLLVTLAEKFTLSQ